MATPNKRPRYDLQHDINEIIQKGQWSDLSTLLQDGSLSDAEQCGAVEAASKHCAESIFLSLISPHCTSSQLHSALPHLASRGLWQAVGHVLQRGVSTALLTWSVHQAARQSAQQELLSFILPHCAEDQLDSVLAVLVKRGLWRAVGVVIQQVQGTTRSWAIEKACQEAWEHKLVCFILPACSAVETACSLAQVVARGLWRAVGNMLQRGVSDTLCIWTLQKAFTQAKCEQIRNHILPHCTRDHLNRFMSFMISKGRWKHVVKLLQCVEENMSTWSVDGRNVDSKLRLSTVRSVEVDREMLQLVADKNWWIVGDMLTEGVGESQHEWLVHTACLHAPEEDFVQHVLPHCSDRLLDSVLTVMVGRRAWLAVAGVLGRGVSDSKKRWAVLKACKHSMYDVRYHVWDSVIDDPKIGILQDILPHCADDMLDSVVTILAERRLWWSAVSVLERGVSDCKKRWVVQKARKDVANGLFKEDFNKLHGSFINFKALCNDEEMRSAQIAREFENGPFNDDFIKKYGSFINIVAHCADDQMDDVLEAVVKGRQWRNVGEALKRNVSDSVKRWAVQEACAHNTNKDTYLISEILPHCADDMLDSVVTILAERLLWRSAVVILERGVSDCKKRWVVQKALEEVKKGLFNEDFNQRDVSFINIVAHCADDQMDDVLEVLVKGRQWRNVGEALTRNVSDSVKRWAVEEACAHYQNPAYGYDYWPDDDDDDDGGDATILINYILPHCADAHLQSVLPTLVNRNLFKPVRYVLERNVSDIEHRKFKQTVFMLAKESLIESVLPCYVYDDIRSELGALASRRLWRMFLMLLHRFLIDTFHSWAIVEDYSESKERAFWDMVSNPCDGVKELSPAQWRSVTWSDLQDYLKDCLHWGTLLCEVLCEALLGTVREIWLSGREKEVDSRSHTAVEEARPVTEDIHQQLNQTLIDCKSFNVSTLLPCIHRLCQKYAGKTQSIARREPPADGYREHRSSSSPLFQLRFLKNLAREYYKRKAWTQMTDAVLVVLTTTPAVPSVQSVALRIMLREKIWDVIRHACLSCVCEQDRRQVFQAAVKQRQWGAVKRWADYSLYDDQRLWALGEAREEKRWDVYLKLAGHGLNEGERMGVLHRVALHADWKLVHKMVNTVADVSYMEDLLTNTRPSRQTRTKPAMCQKRIEQLSEFEEALKKDTNTVKTLKTAAKRGKWQVVLYNIRHKPELQHARRALKAAVSSEAWQTVIQLVRLETDVTRRDSLFRDMIRQQQWAVCRELLDQGVSDDLCVEAMNDLMEHRQWTLVAMVMGCPMSEERRTEMMYRALMVREGSVVWQCINSLQRPLSSEQRENIFQLAFKREVWQAVKPLVENKDKTGIRHRDTALLEAIEQHQWNVVDHCQRHHADINMKGYAGETPIHRAARKGDWEAVKELTVRDGDPNLLDSEGLSVLDRAIEAKQWDLVTLLIQFHGDIHRPSDEYQDSGLNMLIAARQIDVIQSTFMWCADQWKGVNKKGETTLHAACISGCPGILHDLIARRVDPLATTLSFFEDILKLTAIRHSALCYAVLCRDCPQRMVAECIKLGFSVHQPLITRDVERNWYRPCFRQAENHERFNCPFMMAVMRGLPVVTQMLYESGACSNRQLFMLTAYLDEQFGLLISTAKRLKGDFEKLMQHLHGYDNHGYTTDTVPIKKSADYLRQMSRTPRSLVSTCRLVISRCLTLSKTRHRDIAQLPLSPMLKNYLMFTDLTDPDFVGHQIEDRLSSLCGSFSSSDTDFSD